MCLLGDIRCSQMHQCCGTIQVYHCHAQDIAFAAMCAVGIGVTVLLDSCITCMLFAIHTTSRFHARYFCFSSYQFQVYTRYTMCTLTSIYRAQLPGGVVHLLYVPRNEGHKTFTFLQEHHHHKLYTLGRKPGSEVFGSPQAYP